MSILRNRRFTIRHRILAALNKKEADTVRTGQGSPLMQLRELAGAARLREDEVLEQDDFLLHANEIDIQEVETGEPLEYLITPAGIAAYADKKYLTDGLKERMRVIWEWIQIVSTVILLLMGIWAFIDNTIQARNTAAEVTQLKERLQKLEHAANMRDSSSQTKRVK